MLALPLQPQCTHHLSETAPMPAKSVLSATSDLSQLPNHVDRCWPTRRFVAAVETRLTACCTMIALLATQVIHHCKARA